MINNKKIIAVLPAYNAEKTLEKTFHDIPKNIVDEIIVVDDASRDQTVEIANSLKIKTIVHEKNRGYGANQKTCYKEALKSNADVVVMIHPDYQYDARLTPYIAGIVADGICDIVLGNRIRTRWEAISGGMPLYKYIANRILTIFENFLLGQNLGEFHSGFRAYSRNALERIKWEKNSDDFVFDQQFLIEAVACHLKIGDIPVPAKYFAEASSINFFRSCKYGLSALFFLFRFLLHRYGLVRQDIFTPSRQK
ncbi:MAG TPA: glycosyl transferase family 2 [Elusimicrobia bacterium]|nr:MAG: glycosyl transferase family 2 [Elusimicrobia bacterium RIFOXYD2_FULL_34_30]HAM38234.1 glycosyl transferase family 2 [Elusimicrobiota bacterium]